MRGPAIFLAQFIGQELPFDSIDNIAQWAAAYGFEGVQLPTNDARFIDLRRAAESKDYCDDLKGQYATHNIEITELSTHLQGQLMAVHPAYDDLFDGFAPDVLRGKPAERTAWAREQLFLAAKASANLGLKAHVSFSGSLLWPYIYPWPQRPQGLVEEGFTELAKRWVPIFDAFEEAGVDVCFELHPGEDLHDGVSYERFLDKVDHHPRCNILFDPSHLVLQAIDYLDFLKRYSDRVKMFHVKDAEFRPDGRSGAYGGYEDWQNRAGRFRSLGDGQVDFKAIFSHFAQVGFDGWAVLEWECCLKHPEDGAREGSEFIRQQMIRLASRSFDDFADSGFSRDGIRDLLGLDRPDTREDEESVY